MDRRARCRDSRFPVRALRRRMCGNRCSGLTTSRRDAILPSLYAQPHFLYGEFVARTLPVQWADIGVVLGARRHGETSAVVELMTREHGRHLGLVRGGSGARHKPVLQVGNLVSAMWRARPVEQLGYYVIGGARFPAAYLFSLSAAPFCLQHSF